MTTSNEPVTVQDLNLTTEDITEIKKIMATEIQTKRKERVRAKLGCSMCCVCMEIPSKKITYALDGVSRIEAYCDNCFETVYQRTPMNRTQLAEKWNCEVAPENFFGRGKEEYES